MRERGESSPEEIDVAAVGVGTAELHDTGAAGGGAKTVSLINFPLFKNRTFIKASSAPPEPNHLFLLIDLTHIRHTNLTHTSY